MIDVLIQGKLRGAVTVKTASNGNAYATFKLTATDKKNEGVLCSCIVFAAPVVEAVERLADGDSLAVSGEAAISTWRGQDGTPRHGLDVTVHQVLTAYHLGRKRAGKTRAGPDRDHSGDDFGAAGDFDH
jgi:single-stranded DNA-binding protein